MAEPAAVQQPPPAGEIKVELKPDAPEQKVSQDQDNNSPNLEDELEAYKQNPAPEPKTVAPPMSCMQKFEFGIKLFSISFAAAYVRLFCVLGSMTKTQKKM